MGTDRIVLKFVFSPQEQSVEDILAGQELTYTIEFDEDPELGGGGPNFGIDVVSSSFSYVNPNPDFYPGPYTVLKSNPWTRIHRYWGTSLDFVEEWEKSIPRGSCDCYANYLTLKELTPPDNSSPENLWKWGVDIHNIVNQKLIDQGDTSKSIISYEEAKRLWRSSYALWQPVMFGGLERWAISLTKHLLSLGTIVEESIESELKTKLLSQSPEIVWEEAAKFEVPIIMSCVKNYPKIPAPTILVAHGQCEWTKKWVLSSYQNCDKFVAVSEETAEFLREVTNKEVTVIHNGIDTDRIQSPLSKQQAKEELGIPNDLHVLTYTGRMTKEKQIQKILDFVDQNQNYFALIVGWRTVDSIEISNNKRIKILPPQENIGTVLRATDTFLSLSTMEGFGLSVMEALYAGLPVVTTNTGIVKTLTNLHGQFGPTIIPSSISLFDLDKAIKTAQPSTLDLSEFTAEAMSQRWSEFLKTM